MDLDEQAQYLKKFYGIVPKYNSRIGISCFAYVRSKSLDGKAKIALCRFSQTLNTLPELTEKQKLAKTAIDSVIVNCTKINKYDFEFNKNPRNALEMRRLKKILCEAYEKEYIDDILRAREICLREGIEVGKDFNNDVKSSINTLEKTFKS